MSRPTTKQELIKLADENFQKLSHLIASYAASEIHKEFPQGYLNRNIKDVLAHLFNWHLLMQKWYVAGMAGEKPDIPEKGFTWKTVPELNRQIQSRYKDEEISDTKHKLEKSHNAILKQIEVHSDKELFEKKFYSWTGSTSLGAYFISATSSHYDWAIKLIKKCMK